jgi:hypothetical protein
LRRTTRLVEQAIQPLTAQFGRSPPDTISLQRKSNHRALASNALVLSLGLVVNYRSLSQGRPPDLRTNSMTFINVPVDRHIVTVISILGITFGEGSLAMFPNR